MDQLANALGPVFVAGFAVQQLMEFLSPVFDKIKGDKKVILGACSLVAGLALAFGAGLRVLEPFGFVKSGFFDALVTGLVISAGTEGVNSLQKFLGYAKAEKKAAASRG